MESSDGDLRGPNSERGLDMNVSSSACQLTQQKGKFLTPEAKRFFNMLIGIWLLLLLTNCHKRVKPFSWRWPAVRRVGWLVPCNWLLGEKMQLSAALTGMGAILERMLESVWSCHR